ncbi:uncharacterized protein L203_100314 [Cryptococcus depauperatus CBS 7841]|uniref:Uncharacterized protein n=1 Tax=Cryptococcus depauperatus CBS 7841 TaxID=1295531 RepID=A0A1E3IZ74_9TREE|nr:hypothetical protein L203_00026 [Cryptococcus depauperatus CBS 7841]ODN99766.1 hypothetical protein L204_02202 [Cryptococcus depauperatus CBS 7855]
MSVHSPVKQSPVSDLPKAEPTVEKDGVGNQSNDHLHSAHTTENKPGVDLKEGDKQVKDDIIDMVTFQQIMDMDEEDGAEDDNEEKHSFSERIVLEYFEQAAATFKDMEVALERKDLQKLSSLGHFLKGSSAALGIIKVQTSCEEMQHCGTLQDEKTGEAISSTEAIKRIEDLLIRCKADYKEAEAWMKKMYGKDM